MIFLKKSMLRKCLASLVVAIMLGSILIPTASAATTYTVTFNTNGGSKVSSQKVSQNALVKQPSSPKKKGHKFIGWYKDAALKTKWDFSKDKVTKNTTLYAKWETYYYYVHFDSMGGTAVPKQTIEFGKKVTKPADPIRVGYAFGGWYEDKGYKNSWDFNKETVQGEDTLYAKWVAQSDKKVTFNANGGTNVTSQTVKYNDILKAPKNPTKSGYTFAGWYKDEALTKPWDFKKDRVTANTTLYAKWVPAKNTATYNVTFNSNGGSTVSTQTVANGGKVTEPKAPTKSGYTFAGWYEDTAFTTKWDFSRNTVSKPVTLYAKWTPISNKVTFNSNGGNAVAEQTVSTGGKITEPKAPTKSGYTFAGWYSDAALTTKWDFAKNTVAKPVTLYAKWTKNQAPATPSEPTQPSSAFEVIITADELNARSSPSTSGTKVGTFSQGTVVPVKPSGTSGWYETTYNGKTAYISANSAYSEIVAYAAKVKSSSPAKVYSSTSTSSSVVTTLSSGSYVNVMPVPGNNDYGKVSKMEGGVAKKGYVKLSDIDKLEYSTMNIHMPSKVTAAQLNAGIADYANGKYSVFSGMGQTFIDVGNAAGINPVILTSMAILESGSGTSGLSIWKNNIFSVGAYDTSAYDSAYTFSSAKQAIQYQADFLNENYFATQYNDGDYRAQGDILGTKGIGDDSTRGSGAAGMNYYYASDFYWGAKIASVAEDIYPYKASDYQNVQPMKAKSLNNTSLPTVNNDFSNLNITGTNKKANLPMYTTLGGSTTVKDSKGNPIKLQNGTKFRCLNLYGNYDSGWMKISTTISGTTYTGYVDYGSLSNYESKFKLDNLIRYSKSQTYWQEGKAAPAGASGSIVKVYR